MAAYTHGMLIVFASFLLGAQAVTPVEKVVKLLGGLRGQLETEAKAEAAQYDKYACFVKEEADNKLYAIERSTKKIAKLDAEINKLDADIVSLNTEITDLGKEIGVLETNVTDAEAKRKISHGEFLVRRKNVTDAIDACNRAIDALQASKDDLKGEAKKNEALAQVRDVLGFAAIYSGAATDQHLETLTSFMQKSSPGGGTTYSYTYQSNDIVATLKSLRKIFRENRNELDQEEFEVNAAYEKKRLGLLTEKKFAEQEKAEKEEQEAAKQEQLADAKTDQQQETADKASDEKFLEVLRVDSEDKATLWDQRSQVRQSELTQISKAMETLKTGVEPNWGANKKLADLQRSSSASPSVPAGHWEWVDESASEPRRPASFLQLKGAKQSANSAEMSLTQQALKLLDGAAGNLRSPVLAAVALKVKLSEDHFVQVRGLIKDILQRLEDQKSAEATTKSFCDTKMKDAIDRRDKSVGEVEDLASQISGKEADKTRLKADIAELQKAIAANKKALNEATQLRGDEREENENTVSSSAAGKEAVQLALNLLKGFYESQGNALLQKSAYVPPKSDREGNTFGDVAPEVFQDEYKGAQDASKGIIGLLEVILADFDRTKGKVAQDELDAQGTFDDFKKTTDDDSDAKSTEVNTKEQSLATAEDDLVTLTDKLTDAKTSHSDALAELDKLQSMCVKGEETYEERVAKREKEIAALKQALSILENWQS